MNTSILLNAANVNYESHLSMTPDFPFIIHPYIPRSRGIFSVHENLEVLYFLDGEGCVIYDGTQHPVHKGDIVVVNSYSLHQVVPNGILPHFCLIIDTAFCQFNGINPNELLFERVIRSDHQASKRLHRVMDAYASQDNGFRNASIKCAVLDLLLFLCQHYSTPTPADQLTRDPALEYVRRAMGYMKANLSRKLTVDEIADSVGLSKFHFLREFKRITGHTLIDYLNTIRCDYARSLLESGQYRVNETAFLCGFTNNSYFSNVFHRYTGLLPSQVHPSTALWSEK